MKVSLLLVLFALSSLVVLPVAQIFPAEPDATATGYRAFIEEYRHDLQHPDYLPSEQHADKFYDLLQEEGERFPQAASCVQSLAQGLVEFTDFGPLNNLPLTDPFVVSPKHEDVTGKTHFSFLDAYGARLKGGELEVLVNEEGGRESSAGFETKSGGRVSSLSMHYEASAMGYGRGDSQALAPPLRLRAVTKSEVLLELAALSKNYSSDTSSNSKCYCDLVIQHKVSYVMGLIYYPQYGHTLFNGLSNMIATLWRKNISFDDVEFSPYLFRNTSTLVSGIPSRQYRLQWFEMYDELFRFYANDVTMWTKFLDYSELSQKSICFQRVMVGAVPDLDLMNITAPSAMWTRFSLGIMASFYWGDILEELEKQQSLKGEAVIDNRKISEIDSPHDVTIELLEALSPSPYPDYHLPIKEEFYDETDKYSWQVSTVSPYCGVTIVTRDIYNARSILNSQELTELALERGCQVQTIALEKYSLKQQIGQLRWNTTLLISVDGSALLNTLFMHKCSTVMYVELWRRALMIPKFEPAHWIAYTPTVSDTSFVNNSDPIAVHLSAIIAEYAANNRLEELESLNLDTLPFPNKLIENFLRNEQSTTVRKHVFTRVLADSIKYNRRCRRTINTTFTLNFNKNKK